MSEATMGRPGAVRVEAAAREFRRALADGDSALSPGRDIWTAANAGELLNKFNGQPDMSGASFDEKLKSQLASASPEAIQLFAELYCLDLLPLSDYKPTTKRSLVASTLALAGLEPVIPAVVDEAFDAGVLNGGVAFKTRRYWQLCYLVEFAVGMLALNPGERSELLGDPKQFREALDGMTSTNSPSQRAALLYLMFPAFFLPIAKAEHRAQIRAAFADELEQSSGDKDDDLRRIYEALSAKAGGPVDLYQAPYREQWDPKALASTTYRQDPWDRFMSWAARFAQSVDLESEERSYKLEMAARLDAARSELLAATPDWPTMLTSALSFGNLLDYRFKTNLFSALDERPNEFHSILARFWTGEPDAIKLGQFAADLRATITTTPGNAVALGSVLLMARDSAQYPPYRPTPTLKALSLTGTAPSGDGPVERYADLLSVCEQVLDRAPEAGFELQDLLDAQGLVWAVVTYEPPLEWSDADRKAFLNWRGDSVDHADTPGQRAWLVRGNNVKGRDLVPGWLRDGQVALSAEYLAEASAGITRDELKPLVEAGYSFAPYTTRRELVDAFHYFLTVMQDGDLVTTIDQGRLYVGKVSGPPVPEVAADASAMFVRGVRWSAPDGVTVEHLPAELKARLSTQRDVLDLTQFVTALEKIAEPGTEPAAQAVVPEAVIPDADAALAESLTVDQAWLQKCIDLLRDRPQLIFYGPPGTGKTYIARALAEHIAGENVSLVQFHPAYSYEDFFEGFRPVSSGGFELRGGPLRRIVDHASDHPSDPHVLIIDEINRGNLAKVFGELYFLLEYRDQSVELLYSDTGFSLPKNVYIIATMNTADRSIALVDAAMRRRFAFLPLHPSSPPTAGLLRSWLTAQRRSTRNADLLDELNARIDDPDFKIGPSYLMRPAVYADGGLELAWETAILPLLEEHHYGELHRDEIAARYGLNAIAARVDAAAAAEPGGAEGEGDDDAATDL